MRLSKSSAQHSLTVTITFDDAEELDGLLVDLDSAHEHLNWVPAIDALRAGLAPIADDV
jgi:hypothetical protein